MRFSGTKSSHRLGAAGAPAHRVRGPVRERRPDRRRADPLSGASLTQEFIQPEVAKDAALPAPFKAFLDTLRWMDAQSGAKYRGIAAADLAYAGSSVGSRVFVIQKEPGLLSPAREQPVSSLLWFRRPKRWALLHAGHPAVEKFVRLHSGRPGLAAFLCLKMMHLHDGEVPPDQESEYTNLAEKMEARLLGAALKLDAKAAR